MSPPPTRGASLRHDPVPPEQVAAGRLIFGALGPPAAAATAFMVNVFLVRADCSASRVASRLALVLAAAAIAAAGLVLTWRAVRALRSARPSPTGGEAGRNSFLAFFGLSASAVSLLLALYLLSVLLFLDECLYG